MKAGKSMRPTFLTKSFFKNTKISLTFGSLERVLSRRETLREVIQNSIKFARDYSSYNSQRLHLMKETVYMQVKIIIIMHTVGFFRS